MGGIDLEVNLTIGHSINPLTTKQLILIFCRFLYLQFLASVLYFQFKVSELASFW